jgi:D-glycero-D-manno-heptose 1,7-bisphosphate phosphatase
MRRRQDDKTLALHDGIGLWSELLTDVADWSAGSSALFLDRDGVILKSVSYLHNPEDVALIDGATEIILSCNRNKIPVVVVTNQSGIGRGMYGWPEFQAVQAELVALLAKGGASLDLVLACGYHGEAEGQYRQPQHPWRKPRPGMIGEAARVLQLDLSGSWIIGDHETDIEAGRAGGLAGGILVLSGETSQSAANSVVASQGFSVRKAYSIAACRFLVEHMS